jgi:hypothetical protein
MTFIKHDQDKPRFDLIPPNALNEVAKVLTYGARKYDDENWHRTTSQRRYFAAAMRHMWAWLAGSDGDPETGISHLAHAACCLLFMIELQGIKPDSDDRSDAYRVEGKQ